MEWPGTLPDEVKRAFLANPLDPRIWFNLGALAHNDGDGPAAMRGFRRALICEPAFAPAHGHLTVLVAKSAGPVAALNLAGRLAKTAPVSAQNRALVTQYLFEIGEDARVGTAGRASLVLDPTPAGLYRLMALSASRLQEMSEAARFLRRALMLRPDWTAARLALAGAWFALEDFQAVLRELDAALRHEADTAEAALLRGRALVALDRRDDAEQSFNTAIRIDPDRRFEVEMARRTMDASLFG